MLLFSQALPSVRRVPRRAARRRLLPAWALALGMLVACALGAASSAHAQSGTLNEAKEAYQFAEFDRAATLFADVARDPSAGVATRTEAYRYLGRTYVVQDEPEKAREAVEELLQLEPSTEFDPDVEPPPMMNLYYEVRKDMSGYGVQAGPGLQTLAVMDFANNSVDERERFEGLQKGLPAMMINVLNGSTDLKVVERERIQWLLDELEIQRDANLVDQSTAVRTGKLLGANAVVFGNFIVINDRMILSARVVEVETGEVLLGERVDGESESFFDLVEDLSAQIARALNVEIEDREQMGANETKSLNAMMAYSDGLQALENGDYTTAHDMFTQALEYDPSFARAEVKAESIRPMMLTADRGESGGEGESGGGGSGGR